MNCIVVDDEPLAINIIKDFVSKIHFLDLIGAYTNAIQALEILCEKKIDLIFIDIHMPHITGMDFVKTLDKPPMIIFTTAYPEYALGGFELNAVDYLVKPVSFERFLKAVQKAYDRFNLINSKMIKNESLTNQDFVMIKVEYSTVRIDLNNIYYVEGLKDYVKIYTGNKMLMTKIKMKNLEEKLPGNNFIRVHKSFIISLSKIEIIENNRIKIKDRLIPIGNQYRSAFYNLIDKSRLE